MYEHFGPYDPLYAAAPGNVLWDSPTHIFERTGSLSAHRKVIDLGCGDGANALYLEQVGCSVTGFDISSLALNGLANRFARSGMSPGGRYVRSDIGSIGQEIECCDLLVSCGLFQCLAKDMRGEIHKRFHESLSLNGMIVFSCLTDKIALPAGHMTRGVELASLSEIADLFDGLSIQYFREGTIRDAHAPLVAPHEHSVVWILAKKL